ncbi:CvfB family protein [Paraferrimonas sedimenticola]|uniref:GntR family transcriptional regulator n=1 Tax=Paraferrimonas sedimenticola TaxID=375674 RepID=A0AA37RT17_9GAMM|nr:S1-like domain-containing RNA-binding protein [Paraferrimonas sedimenticola]GLP94806.1 GntR family transcriptional regulator [Paraferrimonas sedimenticola]
MAQLGRFNLLSVVEETAQGLYLDAGELGDILLPNRYVPQNSAIGDRLQVFIYLDSEDRLLATTEKPLAQLGDFVSLKVVDVNKAGAFLDWGLPKDLLLPFGEQLRPYEVGQRVLVHLYQDRASQRICASAKLNKFLDKTPPPYETGEAVELIIAGRTDLGQKAIINKSHWGVIFHEEVYQKLYPGMKVKGFVQKVRRDDKINLTLTEPGYGKIETLTQQVLTNLQKNDGFMAVTDKSDPALIKRLFGCSKKSFKQAIGSLYKQQQIVIEPSGIRLISK